MDAGGRLGMRRPFPATWLQDVTFSTTIPGRTNRQLKVTSKTTDRPYVYSEAGTYKEILQQCSTRLYFACGVQA